jgi:hypothetical protein
LNNEGLTHALNGDDDRAIASFSRSLCMFKQLISSDCEGNQQQQQDSQSLPPRTLQLHSSSYPLPQLRNSGFFLFNRAISLAPTGECRPEDNHIYCSVIILNLAVLHHQIALQSACSARRSDALRRAERFYDMVTTILANDEFANVSQPTGLLARLAALNNLAYIRMEKGEFGASGHCFQMMAWLVNFTQVDQSKLFNEEDLEGMMLNVLMANRQSVAPAA